MAFKISLLFQMSTLDVNRDNAPMRGGGWSESVYTEESSLDIIKANAKQLCGFRVPLLGKGFRIVGIRIQKVDPVGASTPIEVNYVNETGSQGALPQKSLEWTVRSADGRYHRNINIRGVPDARVTTGEYDKRSQIYNTALLTWAATLQASWKFRAMSKDAPLLGLKSITAEGILTVQPGVVVQQGWELALYRCQSSAGKTVSGKVKVVSEVLAGVCTVQRIGGDAPIQVAKGQFRHIVPTYPAIRFEHDDILNPDAVMRKIGRPFEEFRGRR